MSTFPVEIVTPQGVVFQGEAVSLIAPGAQGCFEVLAHHAPLTAALKAGKVLLKEKDGDLRTFETTGRGFLSVERDGVVLAVEKAVTEKN
jgi:F-type H+-transporting ATPase subunit epsilon